MAILEAGRATPLASLSEEAAEVAERIRAGVTVVRGKRGGHGSGIVWHEDGIVLTNNHVVSGDRAEVSLADGREFQATVFRRDPERDLAALKIAAQGLQAVPIGDSRILRPGELVLAVGNPLGTRGAVAVGIVSGAPGEVRLGGRWLPEMVQANVALYPGNSGGPLANVRGEVVGINSMVTGPNMALAVPSHVASQFLALDTTRRAHLGVTLQQVNLPEPIALRLGLRAGPWLLTRAVAAGSPADRAGLLPGDLLLALNGHAVSRIEDFTDRIAASGPGSPAHVKVLRGGSRVLDMTAVLAA